MPGRKHRRMNFLPAEMRPSVFNRRTFTAMLLIAGILSPASAALVGAAKWRLSAEHQRTRNHREEISRQLAAKRDSGALSAEQRSLASVKEVIAQRVYWASVFKELGNITPRSLWLTDFETSAGESGRAILISGSSPSQKQVAEFLGRLESSFHFRDIQMRYTEAVEGQSPLTFRFRFEGKVFDAPSGGADESR